MDMLLIVPPGGYYAERWQKGVLMPPLGIGYVAAALEKAGYEAGILDAHVKKMSMKEIARYLENNTPKCIGLTFTTETRFEGFQTAAEIKRVLPDVPIVAGGPHVSLAAADTLEHIREIDYVVVGEGELTAVELMDVILKNRKPETVDGLAYRQEDRILFSKPRQPIKNLDETPFPARHLYPMNDYNFQFDVPGRGSIPFGNIMTSRGCPFHCNFCASPIMWGKRCRLRSPDNIVREIEEIAASYDAKGLWIFDDTFNSVPERVVKICDLIIERKLNLSFFCEVRVDKMSKPLLEKMKEAGCYCIGFGVESGSQRILDEVIRKHLDLKKVEQLIEWCLELDVKPNPFYIFSHPTETMQDAQQTMDLILKYKDKAQASMALLHVYPGTALEKTAYEKGVLPRDFSWTHKDRKEVKTLPSAQGNVPIFQDKLTWDQISGLLFQWAELQNYPIWRHIPKVIRSVKSFDDFKRYVIMGKNFLKRKLSSSKTH